jgi:hypothetical protein
MSNGSSRILSVPDPDMSVNNKVVGGENRFTAYIAAEHVISILLSMLVKACLNVRLYTREW